MVARLVDIDPDGDYDIKETCKILDIHRNTLRRYTKENKLAFEIRLADNKTLYKGREIQRLFYTRI